ncbi:transposase [Heyndrickxia coagulans]|nr:transposase [Heyndrickxia coagulans]
MSASFASIYRRMHLSKMRKFYWKPYFWSRSYLILSTGGAPLEKIKKS